MTTRLLALMCLVAGGCGSSTPAFTTWGLTCTVYCDGAGTPATGTMCWDQGDSESSASGEAVRVCQTMSPCAGVVRCSCTAAEVGEVCETPDVLSFTQGDAAKCGADMFEWDGQCYASVDCGTLTVCDLGDGTPGCTDTNTDAYNCGGCGTKCVDGCDNGHCL